MAKKRAMHFMYINSSHQVGFCYPAFFELVWLTLAPLNIYIICRSNIYMAPMYIYIYIYIYIYYIIREATIKPFLSNSLLIDKFNLKIYFKMLSRQIGLIHLFCSPLFTTSKAGTGFLFLSSSFCNHGHSNMHLL